MHKLCGQSIINDLSVSPVHTAVLTAHSYSDSVVSHPVTCVDTVTVHLCSQCSGACSDVQQTAEVQN